MTKQTYIIIGVIAVAFLAFLYWYKKSGDKLKAEAEAKSGTKTPNNAQPQPQGEPQNQNTYTPPNIEPQPQVTPTPKTSGGNTSGGSSSSGSNSSSSDETLTAREAYNKFADKSFANSKQGAALAQMFLNNALAKMGKSKITVDGAFGTKSKAAYSAVLDEANKQLTTKFGSSIANEVSDKYFNNNTVGSAVLVSIYVAPPTNRQLFTDTGWFSPDANYVDNTRIDALDREKRKIKPNGKLV